MVFGLGSALRVSACYTVDTADVKIDNRHSANATVLRGFLGLA